jgi:hypothetical protein
LQARGHIHSSLVMVDVVVTGVGARVKMAEALRGFAGLKSAGDVSPIEVNAAAG